MHVVVTNQIEENSAPYFNTVPPATVNIAENTVVGSAAGLIWDADATDPENDPITYTLGGADAAFFNFNALTHELRFLNSPDFEAPFGANADNLYDVTISIDDDGVASGHVPDGAGAESPGD